MVIYQRFDQVPTAMVGQGVQIEEEKTVATEKETGIIKNSKSTQEAPSLDIEMKNET
tara:strand:+ start:173 stop:343 length:171 start_codon:yes stop_codon:yes gene_type:complete